MVAAIERISNVAVANGSGLEISETATGWTLNLNPAPIIRSAYAQSDIPPRSGSTYGTGSATWKPIKKSGTSYTGTLASGTGSTFTCVNKSGTKVTAGREILV